jgi:hypothetical protein
VRSPSPALLALLAFPALASLGCDRCADASPGDAGPPPSTTSSAAPAPSASGTTPSAPGTSSASPEKGELRVLKAVFTSEVKNKEPSGTLKTARPGDRVWLHLTVRNRGDAARTITLVFKVNGKERSTVDLQVQSSWSFRTWGYSTLRKGDTGDLSADVKDEGGAVLTTLSIPIKPGDPDKPEPSRSPAAKPFDD